MAISRYAFPPPTNPVLRWLTSPGCPVTTPVRDVLLGQLFASPKTLVTGTLSALALNGTALYVTSKSAFLLLTLIDVALALLRFLLIRRVARAAIRNDPAPTNLNLVTVAAWSALQGAMAFVAVQTGNTTLQFLAGTTVFGLAGPISARYYAAPRFALLLILLCQLPLAAGLALSGNHWLLVSTFQTGLLLMSVLVIVGHFQATTIAVLEAELANYERARHDSLTGLLNRFGFTETLRARQTLLPLQFTLFYLDLDGFKPINDVFGHHVGDKVLQEVARRLRLAARPGDIVARLGGDEFTIVAPNMCSLDGARYASLIISRVAEQPYHIEPVGRLQIGLSIGFACAPEDGPGGEELHRKADAALYEAKAEGKGRYRKFHSFPDVPVPIQA